MPVQPADVKGKGKNGAAAPKACFRYLRSITMPGMPDEPPNLPCLLCHGTNDQLSQAVKDMLVAY